MKITPEITQIPPGITEKLGFYVYKLIDPRNGKVFYIGKGKGDRVLAHIREEANLKDTGDNDFLLSPKLDVIRSLKKEDREPIHVIIRHGMSEDKAELVEAVLIQETPDLTNRAAGRGSNQYGGATYEELIGRYSKEPLTLNKDHKILMIKIRKNFGINSDQSIYKSVRKAWRINVKRAEKADYIFAVTDGFVSGVFVAEKWLRATKSNFSDLPHDYLDRFGFEGREVTVKEDVTVKEYLDKRLPEELKRQGMASPILYTYK